MNIFLKTFALKTIVLCLGVGTLGLSGCNNDNNHETSNTNTPPSTTQPIPAMVTLSGTAAVGAALADASVTAKCNNGSGFSQPVSTDANGKWSGQVLGNSFPCTLQAQGKTLALHSYATAPGTVNITPLTDLSIALASRQLPAEWFKTYQALTEASVKAAVSELRQQLASKNYNLATNFDLFSSNFAIGDAFDQLLDLLNASLQANTASIKDYNSLLTQVAANGSASTLPAAAVTPSPNATTCASKKLPTTSLSSIGDYAGDYTSNYADNSQNKTATIFSLNTQTASLVANGVNASIKEVCGPNVQSNGTNHVLLTDHGQITLFKDTAGKYSAESADFSGFYAEKASTTALCESNGADDKLGFKNAPQDFCGFSKASSIAITSPDIYTFFNSDKKQNVKVTVEGTTVKSVLIEDNTYSWNCGAGSTTACSGVTFQVSPNGTYQQIGFNNTVLTVVSGATQPLTVKNGLLIHFANNSTPPATTNPSTLVMPVTFNSAACQPEGNTYIKCQGNVTQDFEISNLKYYSVSNVAAGGKSSCVIKKSGNRLSITVDGNVTEAFFNGDLNDDLFFNRNIQTTTLRAATPMLITSAGVTQATTIALVFNPTNQIDDVVVYNSNSFACR